MIPRKFILAVLAVFVLAIAAACSSGDDTVTTSSSAGTVQQPQQPAAPAAPQGATGATSAPAAAPAPAVPQAPAAVVPVATKVQKVVMGIQTSGREGNKINDSGGAPDNWQIRPMLEFLIAVDPKTGKLVPQLATEWALEEGPSYRFKLREGVQFQQGWGEFTAKDIVFSWKEQTREDATGGDELRRTVADIQIVNDHEILIQLNGPDSTFLNLVSELSIDLAVQSKAHFDAGGNPKSLSDPPVAGTGPYQFKKRVQGSSIVYERVPYQHWRVTPDFQEFEFRFQSEASTRLASLLVGETQLTMLQTDQTQQAMNSDMKLVQGNVPALRVFQSFLCCFQTQDTASGWRYPDSPLMNPRVRQALNKAVNRDELNQALFGGRGGLMMIPSHLHPTRPGWDPSWETRFPSEYGYDPAAARAILAEEGYNVSNPLETNVFLSSLANVSAGEDIAEAVSGYFQEIGVKANLVTLAGAARQSGKRAWKFDNHIDMSASSSAEFTGFRAYNSNITGRGTLGLQLPEMDALLVKIQAEFDPTKQESLYRDLGEVAFTNFVGIPLFWLPAEIVVNPNIVSDYVWPGNITALWTHVENIKAAK